MHCYGDTTLHHTKACLKETVRRSPSSHNMLQTRLLKGQHVYFWLSVLKAFLRCWQHTCNLWLQSGNATLAKADFQIKPLTVLVFQTF